MRYAQILPFDVCNGEGIGCSLFVQGCPEPHCYNCFNEKSWDFDGGKKWTKQKENILLEIISKPYIKRCSFLGGEPLADKNVEEVFNILSRIKSEYPNKMIWLYSRYTWEEIFEKPECNDVEQVRKSAILLSDVYIDGRYVDSLKDLSLKFCGSKNQRLIDVKKTIDNNKIVLYEGK